MSEHLSTKEEVERYLQRALTPAELLAADDHLSVCSTCRRRLVEAGRPEALLSNVRASLNAEARHAPTHLVYEQLADYVDGRVDEAEREVMDSHLAVCTQCKEEMRDLFAFKETLARAPLAEVNAPATPTFRERFLSSVRTTFSLRPLRLASGLAALALVVLAVTLWVVWKSSTTKPGTQEIVQTQPSPRLVETPPAPPAASPTPQTEQQQSNINAGDPPPAPPVVTPPANPAPGIAPPGAPAETVVALNDGGRRLTVDNQGRVSGLEELAPSEREAVRASLLTGRAPASPELNGLNGRKDQTLMGAPGSGVPFGLQGPVGIVVRTETPTFRWHALEGTTQYSVSVFDSGFNKVMTSGPVTKTEWTAPRALPRGAVYAWQVTALVEGKEIQSPVPPAPEARFRLLSRTQEESVRRAEKLYAGSHLTLGVLYSRAGLLDEAEREFRALLAANPDSQVAKKLLANIEMLKSRR